MIYDFCALALVHLNTLRCPLQFYGFHCDFCSEPKKLFIITTGSKMKSIDLCIQFILNFNKKKIYFNNFENLDLTTFSKSAESDMNLLCIAAEPHSTICTTAIWYHQRIYSLSSAAVIHTLGADIKCKYHCKTPETSDLAELTHE